ncbi:MAG: dTMP kinase [Acidimicrobiales bacterium]|nr:MAG: dTMP kinase [Acidimicrobiales bacterium]
MTEVRSEPAAERGFFIVFEGGDGSGKSTQASRLAARIDAVLTREPGGTAVGAKIRHLVLDPTHPELADRTEALLMAADRAQHVAELIEPTITNGRHVVSDRYVYSSLAYQGVGRGLGIDEVGAVNTFGTGGLEPDLVVLLEVDSSVASERLGDELDRIERAGSSLAQTVAATYREFADANPDLWAVVNGTGTPDEVGQRIDDVVMQRLGLA